MNKKVLTIIILTLIALVILFLYSFGPLAHRRHAFHPNPASLKPKSGHGLTQGMNEYHNKDLEENHYFIAFPQTWRVKSGTTPGSYFFSFGSGTGSVELVDVPDNSTLVLFILSQEEPRLKKEVPGYEKKDYQKLIMKGYPAYELKYASAPNATSRYENVKIYISGQDMAVVITMSVPQKELTSLANAVNTVIAHFRWENQ